jgi:branched-chain amino acid transport system permease protein
VSFIRTYGNILTLALAVAIGPIVAITMNDPYLLSTFERILIIAVAAASLNMILGFGGMVSFGHAVFLGVGAYATGLMANAGLTSLLVQLPVVIVASAFSALFIGAIALRTTGIYFIMITLALAQIFYYIAVSSSSFGGDDGMVIYERTTLGAFYDPFDNYQFYGFVAAVAVVLILSINHLVGSEFGQRLVACRENPARAEALGLNTFGIRLTAFVIAGVFCGLAGFLLANQSEFATPGYANWQRSGELLAIVILGGVGARSGPVLGAFVFIWLEHALSGWTTHWAAIFGPLLILSVLFFRGGLASIGPYLGNLRGERSR